jgi:RNA polymerase sigma-70 factor (ECF subfamily)
MQRGETVQLLADARRGSAPAVERLFERLAPRLLTLIRLEMGPSLRRRLESRDILQGSLLKAFQRLDQLRGDDAATLMGWLAGIARHEIRDQADYHHRQRRDAGRELSLDGAASPQLASRLRSASSRLVVSQELRRLERALESLAPQHREVIVLRRLEELSYPEIGIRLGKSADACRMLFARAMAALTLALDSGAPPALEGRRRPATTPPASRR